MSIFGASAFRANDVAAVVATKPTVQINATDVVLAPKRNKNCVADSHWHIIDLRDAAG